MIIRMVIIPIQTNFRRLLPLVLATGTSAATCGTAALLFFLFLFDLPM